MADAGSMWVENSKLKFVDGRGNVWVYDNFTDADGNSVNVVEFVETHSQDNSGSVWLENEHIHFVDVNGDEYRVSASMNEGSVTGKSGSLWVEDGSNQKSSVTKYLGDKGDTPRLHTVDENGEKLVLGKDDVVVTDTGHSDSCGDHDNTSHSNNHDNHSNSWHQDNHSNYGNDHSDCNHSNSHTDNHANGCNDHANIGDCGRSISRLGQVGIAYGEGCVGGGTLNNCEDAYNNGGYAHANACCDSHSDHTDSGYSNSCGSHSNTSHTNSGHSDGDGNHSNHSNHTDNGVDHDDCMHTDNHQDYSTHQDAPIKV